MLYNVRIQLLTPKKIDADLERLRPERHRRQHHVPAVAATGNADTLRVDVPEARQESLRFDTVPQRLAPVPAVVRSEEGLAEARAAAVVDREDRIPMVDPVLDLGAVAAHRLSVRPPCTHTRARALLAGDAFFGR